MSFPWPLLPWVPLTCAEQPTKSGKIYSLDHCFFKGYNSGNSYMEKGIRQDVGKAWRLSCFLLDVHQSPGTSLISPVQSSLNLHPWAFLWGFCHYISMFDIIGLWLLIQSPISPPQSQLKALTLQSQDWCPSIQPPSLGVVQKALHTCNKGHLCGFHQ